MQKWEYKITKNLSEQQLNALGVEGWGLLQVIDNSCGCAVEMYFKRPKH